MKKWLIFAITTLLLSLSTASAYLVYLYTHRELEVSDFYHDLARYHLAALPVEDLSEIETALAQPYTYLARGRQMSAFESADKRYVLKFFHPRRPLKKEWFTKASKLMHFFSLKWLANQFFEKEVRLEKLFKRSQLAYEELQAETGIVFLHLNPSYDLSITLIDRYQKRWHLSSQRLPFILQKRAELVTQRLNTLVAQKELAQAEQLLAAIQTFFKERTTKGFTDRIQTMHNNYGVIDGQIIQIDFGRIKKEATVSAWPEEELGRIYSNLNIWLEQFYPELAATFRFKF